MSRQIISLSFEKTMSSITIISTVGPLVEDWNRTNPTRACRLVRMEGSGKSLAPNTSLTAHEWRLVFDCKADGTDLEQFSQSVRSALSNRV